MLVKDFLSVATDSSDIYVGKDKYEYTFHGLFCNRWELKKYTGSIRTVKISEEEANSVLNKEIKSISSGHKAPYFVVHTKGN